MTLMFRKRRRELITLRLLNWLLILTWLSILEMSSFGHYYCDAERSSSSTKSASVSTSTRKRIKTDSNGSIHRSRSKNTGVRYDENTNIQNTIYETKKNSGTRMTGVGSHRTKNRSIFSSLPPQSETRRNTFAALMGDMGKELGGDGSSLDSTGTYSAVHTMRGRIFAKISLDKKLLLFFPKELKTDESISEEELKDGNVIVLSTNWTQTIPEEGMTGYTPSMHAETWKIDSDMNAIRGTSESLDWRGVNQNKTSTSGSSGWIPLEGIYGVNFLPSGPHLIVITESELAYTTDRATPHSTSTTNLKSPRPLLEIRRIRSMEIIAIPPYNQKQVPNDFLLQQRQAEERQLRLMRQAFKEHDFYFVPPPPPILGDGDSVVVKDMTHTLQRSFLYHTGFNEKQEKEAKAPSLSATNDLLSQAEMMSNSTEATFKYDEHKNSWWFPLLDSKTSRYKFQKPDSRFFWNEECMQPILNHIMMPSNKGNTQSSSFCTLADHVIPVVSAFIGVQRGVSLAPDAPKNAMYSVLYDQILITRRSKYRAGTRFTRRGSDAIGDVANYAETEQICLIFNKQRDGVDDMVVDVPRSRNNVIQEIYAHVQTRGSIPLRWSSPADVKTYRPRVLIGSDPEAQARSLRSHILEQLSIYSIPDDALNRHGNYLKLLLVNLIDKKSDQGRLGRTFDSVLNAVLDIYRKAGPENDNLNGASKLEKNQRTAFSMLRPEFVKHLWFDFHAECKGGKWGKLGKLLGEVSPVLNEQGYLCVIPHNVGNVSPNCLWKILRIQNGTIRTNCMDCLDRTNVVQSLFGRYIMYEQFRERIGFKHLETMLSSARPENVLGRTLPIEYVARFKRQMMILPWNHGEVSHRLLWADNADAISTLYAGTPALKGDFTRTGKRTRRGALDDGVNSLQRYYLNNFLDADRQEGIDLLVGFAKFDLVQSGEDNKMQNELGFNQLAHSLSRRGILRAGRIQSTNEKKLARDAEVQLGLSWLPGDLQSQLRGAALSAALPVDPNPSSMNSVLGSSNLSDLSVTNALKEIDRRASLEQPWWVVEGDNCGDDHNAAKVNNLTGNDMKEGNFMLREKSSAGGGHILGSLIAATQAPIATAIGIICVMVPGIFFTSTNTVGCGKKDEEE